MESLDKGVNDFSVQDLLAEAVEHGQVVQSDDVSATNCPDSARSYLDDGTGIAWEVPAHLRERATFVIDAEILRPVRTSMRERFAITNNYEFACAWTRAEALAKLDDTPIITWISNHGLGLPSSVDPTRTAWITKTLNDDVVATFAVRTRA